ncbi:MAG TPA: coenzyme F420 hydrogenase, partial [Flavobacteriaceae bacterium]|nr:coenzyme F420 hydrogenase [Flavobacteriaceae bacterium]
DNVFKERIKYTIGLVCGHQKSANYLFSLAQQAGIEKNMLKTVDFRKKLKTENADEYIIEFVYEEG